MLNRVKIVAISVAGAVALLVSVVVAVLTVWESAPPVEPVVQVTADLQKAGEQAQHAEPAVVAVQEAIDTAPLSGPEYDVPHPDADPLHPEEVLLSGPTPFWRTVLQSVAPAAPPEPDQAVVRGSGVTVQGVLYGGAAFKPYLIDFIPSLEEMVVKADIIARVRLLSVKPAGVRSDPSYTIGPLPEGLYIGSLAYRLDVMEYLKGDRATTTITAYAYGWGSLRGLYATTTVAVAKQLGRALLTKRDARWDDREAIVLLRYNAAEQHHYLGLIGVGVGAGFWDFTVASPLWKAWLPDTSSPSATSIAQSTSTADNLVSVEQRFLLDDPADYPTSAVPTATLASLRETVQRLLRELAGGDGSQAYRDCVIYKYELHSQAAGSVPHDPTPVAMLSGMPAGTRVLETGFTEDLEAGRYSELDPSFWSAGPDRDVLLGVWPSVMTASRPLPAGEYNAWLRALSAKERICGDPIPKAWRKVYSVLLTVTSPAGTLAESFFDPYADGMAVTGTTTVGTISWQPPSAGSGLTGWVTADLAVDVTGHVLDFIALDGTVSLSLDVSNATKDDDGVLTWAVPTEPWSPGAKLMLRIRRHDAP